VALLTGRTGAADRYFAVYGNVTGVKFGTQVLYEGYPIGQVEEITPFSDKGKMRFRVDMTITEGWNIPDDSVAHIAASGLLSAITISISAGHNTSILKPGGEIQGREAANMFAAISSVADQIGELSEGSLKPLLDNMNRTVDGFAVLLEGDASVLLEDLVKLVGDVSDRTPRIMDNMESAASRMAGLLDEENAGKIDEIIDNAERLTRDLNETRAAMDSVVRAVDTLLADNRLDVDKTIVDLRHTAESVARHIDAINENMEGASRNMYEFSRQIRQNPGLLLGGTPIKDEAKK
ncbi:MAG: MlaD family protein, partial [Rhodospirillales bacterium]|nr:MlaD family protein [Rhodospirillales bacterium]